MAICVCINNPKQQGHANNSPFFKINQDTSVWVLDFNSFNIQLFSLTIHPARWRSCVPIVLRIVQKCTRALHRLPRPVSRHYT
jgi:hypothetical protein